MSNTNEWAKRINSEKNNTVVKVAIWKFQKEIEDKFNNFLDGNTQVLFVGEYDLTKEPWRLEAISVWKKYNIKIVEKKLENNLTEINVIKLHFK